MLELISTCQHGEVLNWLVMYVRTYLERNLMDMFRIASSIDFRRAMQSLTLCKGNNLYKAEVAKDNRVSYPTIHRYVRLIEVSGIIVRIPAYTVNRTKRLFKSLKIIYVDPALAIFLSGHIDKARLAGCR
jgi:hypothetical protein